MFCQPSAAASQLPPVASLQDLYQQAQKEGAVSWDASLADLVTVTAHPSSILRADDDEQRGLAMDELIADLRTVATWLSRRGGKRAAQG